MLCVDWIGTRLLFEWNVRVRRAGDFEFNFALSQNGRVNQQTVALDSIYGFSSYVISNIKKLYEVLFN